MSSAIAHRRVLSGIRAARNFPGAPSAGFPEGLAARHQGMAGQAARPFPPLWMYRNIKSERSGHSGYDNQIYK